MAVASKALRWLLHLVVFISMLVAVVTAFSNQPYWCLGAVAVVIGASVLLERK
jgi:hypothetical protein